MFDKYINKKVRVLVSSDSGAGISNSGRTMGSVYNSVITVVGVLSNVDGNFIELDNSRMFYYSGATDLFDSSLSFSGANGPDVFENEKTLLNLSKVISISLIREK